MPDQPSVYVVDDDDAMRESLDFLLGTAGFSVEAFDSASAFFDVLSRIQSGCLVTDIRMPGIDGLELLRRVKRDKPTLPVIVMTGHGDVPLAVDAMKLGASDFIEKPFDDQRLDRHSPRGPCRTPGSAIEDEAASEQVGFRVAALSPRETTSAGGARRRPLQQGDRARLRHQPAHGGGLSRQCNDQDATATTCPSLSASP